MVSIKKRCVILSVFVLVWIVGFSFMCRGEDTVYDEQKALSWLELQVNGKLSVSEIALGMLAIKQGRSNMGNYVNILEAKMDSVKGCFPSGDCGFKETALAVLALKGEGKSVDKSVKWIKDNMGVARESDIGEWYLQITTDGKGDCYVYEGETQKAKLTVNGDEQISFNNKLRDWVGLNEMGIVLNEPLKEIAVDCKDVDDSVIVSLLRIKDNVFYIEQESYNKESELVINNACFKIKESITSCDKSTTFYVSWVLTEIDEEVLVLPYLRDNLVSSLDYAMMNVIEPSEEYAELLKNKQRIKYWDNVYITSFVIYSLKGFGDYDAEVSDAVEWLESQQNDDGSFGTQDKVLNTAVAVYLGLGDKETPPPADSDSSNGDGTGDGSGSGDYAYCGDGIVEGDEECDLGNDTIKKGAKKDCEGFCDPFTCECRISTTSCYKDGDCLEGQKCDLIYEECYAVTNCISDSECRSGEECDKFAGTCKKEEAPCTKNDDCDPDEMCDELTRKCVPIIGGCVRDSQCGVDEICEDGICMPEEVPDIEIECNDGIDDDGDRLIDCKDDDCKDDEACKKSYWWVWLIIIIVILFIGAVFLYGKFAGQKKPTSPGYFEYGKRDVKPNAKPEQPVFPARRVPIFRRSQSSPRDTELERKLDKSIKDVEKALKGGK